MIKKFLNLGPQPLANKYLSRSQIKKNFNEYFYNLKVGFNTKTKLVSILHTISSKKMFDNKYPYRSSMSKTMLWSFQKFSRFFVIFFIVGGFVVMFRYVSYFFRDVS